jgi:hypothetical protein
MNPLNISGTWTIRLADVKWGNTREAAGWKRNQKSIKGHFSRARGSNESVFGQMIECYLGLVAASLV